VSTIEDVLTPLSDQESSRVSMPSVVELKGAGLIKAIKIGIILLIDLVVRVTSLEQLSLAKFNGE
jgi:hypothetical protein